VNETYYWHDYETWGADPFRDRPVQFAGLRTDPDFNLIGEPLLQYCRPSDDFLPSPEACMITGITPQKALTEGLPEAEFIAAIHEQMSQPGTCTVGYNNIRFDDEITRHALYRNFFDPYAREWQGGNSRWDLIDVVRLAYAVRPEGIQWPTIGDENADEVVSFRLDKLTEANGIEHSAAHDALSDVHATIALARLLKTRQPRLFDYAFRHRKKQLIKSLLDIPLGKPLFHVSSKYPAHLGCCAVVAPVAMHPENPNGVIVADLRVDPATWLNLSVEQIKQRIFVTNSALQEEGLERIPLKVVHLNKCPILVETRILKSVDARRLSRFQLDGKVLRKHLQVLRSATLTTAVASKIAGVFAPEQLTEVEKSQLNPDFMLYSGGFFNASDRQKMEYVREKAGTSLADVDVVFDDPRLPEMLFRYRARNFPESLSELERECWDRLRYEWLTEGEYGLSFDDYFRLLKQLADRSSGDPVKIELLQELQIYGESIIPYL